LKNIKYIVGKRDDGGKGVRRGDKIVVRIRPHHHAASLIMVFFSEF